MLGGSFNGKHGSATPEYSNTEEQAMSQLAAFSEKWEKQYPTAVHSWEENWDILSTYFDYPVEIRKIIYTTNAIEGLNRQFRKVTKTKNVFPNDDSLRKMLYLAIQNLSSRWTQRCRNWDLIINQLRIMDSSEGRYVIKNEKKVGMKSTQ